ELRSADHVIIETSGLAAPTAVMQRIAAEPLNDKFILDAVVTVIDVPWLLESSVLQDPSTAPVFSSQLTAADIIVLNKIDDLSSHQLETAADLVRTSAPSVRFLELAHHAHLEASLLLGMHLHEPRHQVFAHAVSTAEATADGHSHSGLGAHEHGLLTHTHM